MTKEKETEYGNAVAGRVVEIGNIAALGNSPGILIETTEEQLRAHGRNLAFADVIVILNKRETHDSTTAH